MNMIVKKGIAAAIVALTGAGYAHILYLTICEQLYGWSALVAFLGLGGVTAGCIICEEIEKYGI